MSAALTPGLEATFDMPQYPGQQYDATAVTTSRWIPGFEIIDRQI